MSTINVDTKEISLKIVYYGPGLSGKTTSLRAIHENIPESLRPKMVSVATEEERTLFFDFLPVTAYKLGAYLVRLHLYTVPGQVHYKATRRLVLNGADGVVFVADSQLATRAANLESLQNLHDNLQVWGMELKALPHVLQFNKRDLNEIMPVEAMNKELNRFDAPYFATVALQGKAVQEPLRVLTRLVIKDLKAKGLGRRRPESSVSQLVRAEVERNAARHQSSGARRMPQPPAVTESKPPRPAERDVAANPTALNPQPTTPPPLSPPPTSPLPLSPPPTSPLPLSPPPTSPLPLSPPPTGPLPSSAQQERRPWLAAFSTCWADPGLHREAVVVEDLLRSGRYGEAVIKAAQLMSLAAQSAGYDPNQEAQFALVHGLTGRRYRHYRKLVSQALRGEPPTEVEALFVLHFVTEIPLTWKFSLA